MINLILDLVYFMGQSKYDRNLQEKKYIYYRGTMSNLNMMLY